MINKIKDLNWKWLRMASMTALVASNASAQDETSTLLEHALLQGDETITTPYGTVELQHNYLTDESSRRLFDAMDLQRAAQAYI